MAGGGELERPGQVLLRALDVEGERALGGEGEVATRRRFQLLGLVGLAERLSELERLHRVVGEHVGRVFHPLACLALDPGGRRSVACRTAGARDLLVADVPAPAGARSRTRLPPPSNCCGWGGRAPCARARAAPVRPRAARVGPSRPGRPPRTPCRARPRPGAGSSGPGRGCPGARRSAPAPSPAPPPRPARRGRRAGARTPRRRAGCRPRAPAAPAASQPAAPPARAARRSGGPSPRH